MTVEPKRAKWQRAGVKASFYTKGEVCTRVENGWRDGRGMSLIPCPKGGNKVWYNVTHEATGFYAASLNLPLVRSKRVCEILYAVTPEIWCKDTLKGLYAIPGGGVVMARLQRLVEVCSYSGLGALVRACAEIGGDKAEHKEGVAYSGNVVLGDLLCVSQLAPSRVCEDGRVYERDEEFGQLVVDWVTEKIVEAGVYQRQAHQESGNYRLQAGSGVYLRQGRVLMHASEA